MPKATFNGEVIAEADMNQCSEVEGNIYFPMDSVKKGVLSDSPTPYTCPWKGKCQYHDVTVNGETCKDCAFSYPEPSEAAKEIKGKVAFYKDVIVD